MPWYKVVTPLLRDQGKPPVAPDTIVVLDEGVGGSLVLLKALEPADEPEDAPPAPPEPPAPPSDKPLADMKRPELAPIAARLGIEVRPGMTNKAIVLLIEAKRAEGA